jgi:hypothetical protein
VARVKKNETSNTQQPTSNIQCLAHARVYWMLGVKTRMRNSDIMAVAALLISLASLLISMRNFMRDRYRLRFDGFMLVTSGSKSANETYQLGVTITNEGRRPVSITEIYFETDPTRDHYPIRTPIHGGKPDAVQPVALAENETHRFISKAMKRKEALELSEVIDICVEDSAGRFYHIPVQNDSYEIEKLDA